MVIYEMSSLLWYCIYVTMDMRHTMQLCLMTYCWDWHYLCKYCKCSVTMTLATLSTRPAPLPGVMVTYDAGVFHNSGPGASRQSLTAHTNITSYKLPACIDFERFEGFSDHFLAYFYSPTYRPDYFLFSSWVDHEVWFLEKSASRITGEIRTIYLTIKL